jgi:hypothetical protein
LDPKLNGNFPEALHLQNLSKSSPEQTKKLPRNLLKNPSKNQAHFHARFPHKTLQKFNHKKSTISRTFNSKISPPTKRKKKKEKNTRKMKQM